MLYFLIFILVNTRAKNSELNLSLPVFSHFFLFCTFFYLFSLFFTSIDVFLFYCIYILKILYWSTCSICTYIQVDEKDFFLLFLIIIIAIKNKKHFVICFQLNSCCLDGNRSETDDKMLFFHNLCFYLKSILCLLLLFNFFSTSLPWPLLTSNNSSTKMTPTCNKHIITNALNDNNK